MVIDDSKTIRRTAETLLQKEGYQVISATDGFEALSMIADNKPDLVFLDVMMPREGGAMPGIDRRIVLGGQVSRVDHVLDGDRNTVKWPARGLGITPA